MRWIEEKEEYHKIRDFARACVDIDSRRLPTDKRELYFCDVTAVTERFPSLLQYLLAKLGDPSCVYMVLDPDPEYLWHDRLGGYPVFEFGRCDSSEEYFKFLNRPFGSNPGDNMADMWYSYVIFPLSQKWFVHTIRSDRDDSGHLWIPREWAEEVTKIYSFIKGEHSRLADA
jgi:hypothetical protein